MPSALDIFSALKLARAGSEIRRSIWRVSTGITIIPAYGDLPLAWIKHVPGGYIIRRIAGNRVVQNDDVTLDDFKARDWTTDPVTGLPTDPPDGWNHPYPPPHIDPPPGSLGGSGGTGGTGGTGGGSGGTGGGSGGSGDGGSTPPTRRPRPVRSAPALTLTVSRTSGSTCSLAPSITDSFSVSLAMAADPFALPGEVWFVSIICRAEVIYHGTMAAGATVATTKTLTGPPGTRYAVQAHAHLPRVGLDAQDTKPAIMRLRCSGYTVSAQLAWSNNADLDLYGRVDAESPAWYGNLMGGGGLSLNQDSHPGCVPTPSGPELITGGFDGSHGFAFWYNQFSNCEAETAPTIATVTIHNIGSVDITVNGSTLAPGASTSVTITAYAGYNTGGVSTYPSPTTITVVVP